ncbi:MAG TPA: amidohydrolase family protein, partial [Acidimicrobiales bacterium]|nr:amidohydrolase family protein [Acidimicrobiales bacterium]
MTGPLHLRDVEVDGARVDVTIEGGRVSRTGSSLPVPAGAEVVEGAGGALLPGLWDHHIHVVALAAARRSVPVGPPAVADEDGLAGALRHAAAGGGWVRAVGYHESVAGLLDRDDLDRLAPGAPVRVQHRSGACWILSDAAVQQLGLDGDPDLPAGVERAPSGRLTGRVYGADRWLRERLDRVGPEPSPDLADVGRELAGYGIVGVTDATPYEHLADLDLLARAAATGELPQRVVAMGGPALADEQLPAPLGRGPVKLLLADHSLPSLDELVGWIATAHAAGRPVAAHCVTRAALVLALAALDEVGAAAGDRIEHGSVVPPELVPALRDLRLTVVTQPGFVAERGDRYLDDVDADDRPHLYPCRSLLDAGVPVAGSTDAPFGHPDPWRAVAAAIDRRTAGGQPLGPGEAVDPATALGLLLGPPDDPGGRRRRVEPGAAADLCLLDAPLADALAEPSAERVRLTAVDGAVVHRRS